MSHTLVINPGSSSKKYALFKDRKTVLEFQYEKTFSGIEMCIKKSDGQQDRQGVMQSDFDESMVAVAEAVKRYLQQAGAKLDFIGVRIVAPGSDFQKHQKIDEQFIVTLRQREFAAPTHIPVILQEIDKAKRAFPFVPVVGASDSAFHATMPKRAREYSIDVSDAQTYDIYRFGYHGLSVASVFRRVHPVTGVNPKKLVVCHIGGGVSVTAVENGVSIATTMGYSPASGLPMGSRAGDIDPGGLLQLMRAKNLRPSEAEVYIHNKGGLLGLSGDADIRQLLDRRSKGDAVATQTLEHFTYHIRKAIAAATAALNGVDMVLLTGTAASRSVELRTMLLSGFEYLGIELDEDRNNTLIGKDGIFSKQNSETKAVVIRTDEMGEMAVIAEQIDHPVVQE